MTVAYVTRLVVLFSDKLVCFLEEEQLERVQRGASWKNHTAVRECTLETENDQHQ